MNPKRKYKKPKHKTKGTTNPQAKLSLKPTSSIISQPEEEGAGSSLLQKDSTWIGSNNTNHEPESEEILQLVECEEGLEVQPLAVLFPGILHNDPETVNDMLTHTMSTIEVTKHLVELGQKADFRSIKKTKKIIPMEKRRLDSVPELEVMNSREKKTDVSEYEADSEPTSENTNLNNLGKKKIKSKFKHESSAGKFVHVDQGMSSDSTEASSSHSHPNSNSKSYHSDHGYEADAETDNNDSTEN